MKAHLLLLVNLVLLVVLVASVFLLPPAHEFPSPIVTLEPHMELQAPSNGEPTTAGTVAMFVVVAFVLAVLVALYLARRRAS